MSQDTLPKVAERFFRADSSGSILGTGLGMSIVKEIVALSWRPTEHFQLAWHRHQCIHLATPKK